ncbi:hypothetical protein E2986_11861 [Frieseomelitta varia]|uniref:Uncharacterized protein n=1 Tax=Frieseomelitta varia TaxID=561572 RepID=A0A833W180_9HYME|nr:hypothetical protein E2986_11861 [Frieseomelitta varia]
MAPPLPLNIDRAFSSTGLPQRGASVSYPIEACPCHTLLFSLSSVIRQEEQQCATRTDMSVR